MLGGIPGTEELEDGYCYLHVVVAVMSVNFLFATNNLKITTLLGEKYL